MSCPSLRLRPPPQRRRAVRAPTLLALALLVLPAPRASAFSQSSPATPMGHEFITVASALQLLAEPPPSKSQLAKDKGRSVAGAVTGWLEKTLSHSERMSHWTATYRPQVHKLLAPHHRATLKAAKPADEWPRDGAGSYGSRYYNVWSAVMGQRWVDLGGFNVVRSTKCWEAMTQMADHQQPDHFLRRRGDAGPKGAAAAIDASRAAFRKYFVEAALADPKDEQVITFRDGGVDVTKRLKARKAYFLFGRAAHLFQDSFSPEHGLRDPKDPRKVLDIKSYVCTLAAPQHTHDKPVEGHHGDVVWLRDFGHAADYSWSNLKPGAIVALVAMEELWTAFLYARTTAQDRKMMAERMADQLAARWFQYDPKTVGTSGGWISAAGQRACDKAVGMPAVATTERARCLKLIKSTSPETDAQIGLGYSWLWLEDL